MTVSVSNTNLNDSFNSWRLNTNFAATVLSNNVVTVARAGSANRGGVAKGNGHIAGTFTANELRTVRLHSGNTSNEGNFIQIASNTAINATSFSVTANAVFQGNVDFVTSGTDRLILGDISRIRVTGGTSGQFLRMEGGTDTPNFKTLTLRDISDLSSNSADIILSGANTTFSDNNDSPALVLTNGTDRALLYMASDVVGDSDVYLNLVSTDDDSTFVIADSANTAKHTFKADGTQVTSANVTAVGFTSSGNILPVSDDAVDLGAPNREFRNAYIDGVANIDELSVATGASQGVSTSLIPKTDAAGNLGSATRKWGTVWADTTNGGVGVFKSLGVSGALVVNGDITINSDNMTLVGNTVIGDATTDTITFTAQVDSDFDPQTGSQRDMGSTSNRWHNVYANNVLANNVVTDNDVTVGGDLVVNGSTTISSGQILTASSGVFTTLGVLSTFTANGNVDLGNATTDTITATGQFDSDLVPATDDAHDLGTSLKQWRNLYIDGTASIDTLTVDVDSTLGGHRATVSGNVHVGDTVILTNGIKDGSTTIISKNNKLHANNTITNGTLTTAMLANTMAISTLQTHGSASAVPIITVNGKGQVIGISNTTVAGVTALTYTQSNNNIRIGTATGTTFDDVIDPATTTSGTGRGVASFDSGDFSVSSGHVTLANGLNGAVLAISGTANEVNVSRSNGTVTVGLPDDVTVTGQLNVGENVVITGNLTVSGTTTTVNSETVNIADNIIVLNSDVTGTPSQNGGISIERGTSTNVQLRWNETSDKWQVTENGTTYYDILKNDGTFAANSLVNTKMSVANTQALANARLGATATVAITGAVAGGATAFSANAVSIAVTQQNNSVTLGTHTTGNYVATITAGDGLDSTGATTGESISHTLSLEKASTSNLGGAYFDANNFTVLADGLARIKDNGIALGTETSGNYVGTIVAGAGIDTTGASTGEGIAHTISIESDLRGDVTQIGQDTNDYYSIGTTQHNWYLDGAEDMRLTNDGTLDVSGDVISHSATISDERLKENIEQVTDAVSKVQQLNGYTFNYKKDGREGAGIIAQEVAEVLPSAVKTRELLGHEGEYMIVEYDQLTALLIESIKELKAEIDELKNNK